MVKNLVFNEQSSKDLGLVITSSNLFNAPQLSYSAKKIDGRNGSLITCDGSYQNVELTVKMMWRDKAESITNQIKSWLLSTKGYSRLESDYQMDYYRMAMVSGTLDFDVFKNRSGSVEVTFTCKPQLYLKSGEQVTTLTTDGIIDNPTLFDAKPLIRVYGVGKLGIGSETITITKGATEYIDIDCDIQDCYEGLDNRNGLVSLTDFPTLPSGNTGITLGTGITKVEITPRWWTL